METIYNLAELAETKLPGGNLMKNLTYQNGIIPSPPNYFEGGLRFDMVTLDQPGGSIWSYIGTSTDMLANDEFIFQMLYATPLTQEQMDKLKYL